MRRPGEIPAFCLPEIWGSTTTKFEVEKGKNGASLKLAHLRGSELQVGTRLGSSARAKGQEEKAIKPDSTLCGPVCGFGSRVGK